MLSGPLTVPLSGPVAPWLLNQALSSTSPELQVLPSIPAHPSPPPHPVRILAGLQQPQQDDGVMDGSAWGLTVQHPPPLPGQPLHTCSHQHAASPGSSWGTPQLGVLSAAHHPLFLQPHHRRRSVVRCSTPGPCHRCWRWSRQCHTAPKSSVSNRAPAGTPDPSQTSQTLPAPPRPTQFPQDPHLKVSPYLGSASEVP